jgi:hypothetical protein
VRQIWVLSPVGLKQDAVDLFQVDGFGAVADGLEHGAEAEILDPAQDAFVLGAELMSYAAAKLTS